VTQDKAQKLSNDPISIHTPAWGVTADELVKLTAIDNFNPHARVGRDIRQTNSKTGSSISIHTPAWGVTNVFGD